jgi:hypothetical protein
VQIRTSAINAHGSYDETRIRVGMEDAALGIHRFKNGLSRSHRTCARWLRRMRTSPQPVNTMLKDAQLSRVTRDSMVLVVAQHNLAKPCTDLGRRMMLPALKFSLDGHRLRGHPPLRRNPPDDEGSIADTLPTVVGETQEGKGIRFSLSALLPISSATLHRNSKLRLQLS